MASTPIEDVCNFEKGIYNMILKHSVAVHLSLEAIYMSTISP